MRHITVDNNEVDVNGVKYDSFNDRDHLIGLVEDIIKLARGGTVVIMKKEGAFKPRIIFVNRL